MKGLIFVFVVVSMEGQAAVNSCLKICKDERTGCLRNPNKCHDLLSCEDNCHTPFERCTQRCSRKRELLSKFFQQDHGKEE